MATQKPISTIVYNTEPFLFEKLEDLYSKHIIQAYQYAPHLSEDGCKEHGHLRLEPNKRLDPMDLTDFFTEYVHGEVKPRVPRPWRPSKETDWFLYVVHDSVYLQQKYGGGQQGEKIPYDYHIIRTSSGYDLDDAFARAKSALLHSSASIVSRLEKGESGRLLLSQGENPAVIGSVLRVLEETDYTRKARELSRLNESVDFLMFYLRHAHGLQFCPYDNSVVVISSGEVISLPKFQNDNLNLLKEEKKNV